MTSESNLERSAEAISIEIGLDLSYFTDESERNLLHLALPIGYVLLTWFIEGVATGVGEATGEGIAHLAAGSVKRLGARVRRLFGRREAKPEADVAVEKQLATQAQATLAEALQALAASSADDVTRVAEAYEQALVGYLTDDGMPGRDAVRIAQRVRAEAESSFGSRAKRIEPDAAS